MSASRGKGCWRKVVRVGTLAAGALLAVGSGGCVSRHRAAALEHRVAVLEAELYELRAGPGTTPPSSGPQGPAASGLPSGHRPAGSATPRGPARAVRRLLLRQAWNEVCDGPGSVPLEVAGSRHFVDVTLQGPKGNGRFRFQVDTAGSTPGLTVARSAVEVLGFKRSTTPSELPRSIGLGGRDVALPDGVGWALVEDEADATRKAPAARSFGTPRDYAVGQIGAGFLSRFLVCIDGAGGRLGLADPAAVAIDPDDASAIPILVEPMGPNRALYPFVHVLLEARGAYSGSYGMLLDTGAASSMLEARELQKQSGANPDWPRAKGAAGDADMLGGAWPETMLRAPALYVTSPGLERWRESPPSREEWAEFPKLHPPVDAGPALLVERPQSTFRQMFREVGYAGGPQGALGNDVLAGFRLMIDYQGARLWLERQAERAAASASMQRIGVALAFGAEGCPIVRQITDTNAEETRTKLRVGDVLLSVDGEPVCQAWRHQLAERLAGKPGDRRKLELRRGAQQLMVELPVVDLLAPRGAKRPADARGAGRAPGEATPPAPKPAPKRGGDKLFGGVEPAPKPSAPRPTDPLFR